MHRVLYLTSSVRLFGNEQFGLYTMSYIVVIPLLLHRYQYCVCISSMLNVTCASITLHSLCLVLVLLSKYSYGAMHIRHLN